MLNHDLPILLVTIITYIPNHLRLQNLSQLPHVYDLLLTSYHPSINQSITRTSYLVRVRQTFSSAHMETFRTGGLGKRVEGTRLGIFLFSLGRRRRRRRRRLRVVALVLATPVVVLYFSLTVTYLHGSRHGRALGKRFQRVNRTQGFGTNRETQCEGKPDWH